MLVRPKAGLKVRDPVTRLHIPDSGYEIMTGTDSHVVSYWVRRLASGDVVVVDVDQNSRFPRPE